MTTILYGTLREDGTLQLDEKVDGLPPGRVRLVVEEAPNPRNIIEVINQIRRDQEARGDRGRSREETAADEERERIENEEYEEYWRQIWTQTQSGIPPMESSRFLTHDLRLKRYTDIPIEVLP